MKQDNVLILIGIVALLLAALVAFDDNLSELSLIFLGLGLGNFGWLIYRRTWGLQSDKDGTQHVASMARPSKISSTLGISGLLCFGLSGFSLFAPALEEFGLIGYCMLLVSRDRS